jgi:hypothetical protein
MVNIAQPTELFEHDYDLPDPREHADDWMEYTCDISGTVAASPTGTRATGNRGPLTCLQARVDALVIPDPCTRHPVRDGLGRRKRCNHKVDLLEDASRPLAAARLDGPAGPGGNELCTR